MNHQLNILPVLNRCQGGFRFFGVYFLLVNTFIFNLHQVAIISIPISFDLLKAAATLSHSLSSPPIPCSKHTPALAYSHGNSIYFFRLLFLWSAQTVWQNSTHYPKWLSDLVPPHLNVKNVK